MKGPLVIAHRGASGYRPEHTLEAYELGIRLGADSVEPDLVATRDGVLVARHENELSGTTDVALHPEFASRRTAKQVDGKAVSGWFCEDFTLEEVKTLRVRERLPFRSHEWDGLFSIPTLQDVVDLARRWSALLGREIGVYPETKHPTYFRSVGLSLEPLLVELLRANGWGGAGAPVYIQSFETANLRELRRLTELPLVQLLGEATDQPYDLALRGDRRTCADLARPAELEAIAEYASVVACSKRLLVPEDPRGRLAAPTALVRDAHRLGLQVHAWTFRSDPCFLAPDYGGDPAREYAQFLELGVDGVFTDFPDTAAAARANWLEGRTGRFERA